MKKKIYKIIAFLLVSMFYSINSFAASTELIDAADERLEISDMGNEILSAVNDSGPRSELSRDITINDIDFDRVYRVYGNSGLFDIKTYKRDNIISALESGSYIWQVPIYVDGTTVLVDISKTTHIRDDIPEEAKKRLQENLGQWTTGAVYVYNNEIVDYQENIQKSLLNVGLVPDNYSYAIVSGLPGIRYPVAVIIGEEKAEFIIPAEKASAQFFDEETEDMKYTADLSDDSNSIGSGFSVYDFNKIANAISTSVFPFVGRQSGTVYTATRYLKLVLYLTALVFIACFGGFIWKKKNKLK